MFKSEIISIEKLPVRHTHTHDLPFAATGGQ